MRHSGAERSGTILGDFWSHAFLSGCANLSDLAGTGIEVG